MRYGLGTTPTTTNSTTIMAVPTGTVGGMSPYILAALALPILLIANDYKIGWVILAGEVVLAFSLKGIS